MRIPFRMVPLFKPLGLC